jgi:hypothetical protein
MSRTIALPGHYVAAFGSLLVALGLALPIWSVYRRTHIGAARMEISAGPVRSAMVTLPPMPDGRTIAIAESEVTQGHFHRVMLRMPPTVASPAGGAWQRCPVPFNADTLDKPVTCVAPFEAAAYANGLTLLENSAKEQAEGRMLSVCYVMGNSVELIPDCTGFRLPTVDEWLFAARANTQTRYAGTDDPDDLCGYANVPGCRGAGGLNEALSAQDAPNGWHLHAMTGNASELMMVRSQAVWKVGGGSWRTSTSLDETLSYQNRSADLGFRVVREVSGRVVDAQLRR